MVEELVPRALQAAEHRVFKTGTPWAQANYAMAVSYAMILNSLGLLLNEEVEKLQISKAGAKAIISQYLTKLNGMESTIKAQYNAKYPLYMHPTNCAYSYPMTNCIVSVARIKEFRFTGSNNAMMEALTFKSELVQKDWLAFDSNAMVDTTQIFLNGLVREFSQ